MNASRVRRIIGASLGVVALALASVGVVGQGPSSAVAPTTTIKLFDGTSLANFDTWLVDHHEKDPEKVFTVVDQIDGAPAIRISGQVWGGLLRWGGGPTDQVTDVRHVPLRVDHSR